MFSREQAKKEFEDELLKIFIILEKNTFRDTREAIERYALLKGFSNLKTAENELLSHYRDFMGKMESF